MTFVEGALAFGTDVVDVGAQIDPVFAPVDGQMGVNLLLGEQVLVAAVVVLHASGVVVDVVDRSRARASARIAA